jgi:hypothetical protein
MRAAFLLCCTFCLALTGLGLFGVIDHLRTRPGWEALRKDDRLYKLAPQAPLEQAYKDLIDSMQRSRNVALGFSLASLAGGIGLGFQCWRMRSRRVPPVRPDGSRPDGVCNICGATLRLREMTRGTCEWCERRAK